MADIYGTIDDRTYRIFSEMIYTKCGIVLTEKKRALLQARLGKRMRKIGLSDFKDYLKLVQEDTTGNEIIEVLDAISTNVTHFFRENAHFEFLDQVLRKWDAKGKKCYRIWCAAASTGEEPYSIAITMNEALSDLSNAKILATDINTRVLTTAKQGVYAADKVERISPAIVRKYFTKTTLNGAPAYEANLSIQELLKFGRLNLVEPPYPVSGPIDVIFCRNVMIYFDNLVRKKIIEEFIRVLAPGGYLIVGHAESLTGSLGGSVKTVAPAIYIKN